jgi:hypothetical protein
MFHPRAAATASKSRFSVSGTRALTMDGPSFFHFNPSWNENPTNSNMIL